MIVSPQEAQALALHFAKNLGYDISDGIPKEILYDPKFMENLYAYLKRLANKRQQDDRSSAVL